jgi:hypothetical protein
MAIKIAHKAHRLDAWLKANVGRPYTAILSIGLIIAMVDGVGKLSEKLSEGGELFSSHVLTYGVSLVFQLALFINLLAQWHEHREAHGGGKRENRQTNDG